MSITVARDVTDRIRPPRALFVPFRMGHHFGVPFHERLQTRVIRAALDRLVDAESSGDVASLGVSWAAARREGIEIERRRAGRS